MLPGILLEHSDLSIHSWVPETPDVQHSRTNSGAPGGSVVECLPSAQVVIPGSQDPVPHRALCMEPASPSACVSAFLSLSLHLYE